MVFRWLFLLLFLPFSAVSQKPLAPNMHARPADELQLYQKNLALLRKDYTNHIELPNLSFFLFGMGNRLKLIYRKGRLLNALTGNIEEQWAVKEEIIIPSAYLVHLVLTNGQTVQILEDETGVWLLQSNKRPQLIPGTRSRLSLPRFTDKRFGPVLKVLHHELLINVINSRPVPNFLVYQKPRYPDAALMGMVLKQTSNLPLIYDWIMAIRDPFDRANHGRTEVDNIGQVLFLVSLVSDKTHPVVQMALDSVGRYEKDGYILSQSDDAEHPVYQTKWLKYGLKSLNLPDQYQIPAQYDSYSSLFWWDYIREHVAGKQINESSGSNSPYLNWAEDHFYHEKRGAVNNLDYPLSWERQASGAHYPGLTVLDKELVRQKLAFPSTRHAAEMFLLLIEQ